MNAGKKIGIWVRVSTEDQAKGESPEHHEERARMYATVKNWDVVEVYHLEGVSGKSVVGHAEARRMLRDIEEGKITGLIFSKIARLARNTKELLEIADFFKNNNADLISLEESIDTSSPAGRFFYTLLSAMAQWEREEIAGRVKSAAIVRAQLGKPVGGAAPFGYAWVNRKMVLDEKEAPIRKLMFELYHYHRRQKTVVSILNERGYRTRNGSKWSTTSLMRLLQDPIAKGIRRSNYSHRPDDGRTWEYKPEEEWVIHEVPAIVSEELWDAVNTILNERSELYHKPLNYRTHLFTRIAKCHCGNPLQLRTETKRYRCTKCKNYIEAEALEAVFKENLKGLKTADSFLEDYEKGAKNTLAIKEKELGSLRKQLNDTQREIEQLLKLNREGQIPDDGFKAVSGPAFDQLRQLKKRVPELEGEIMAMRQEQLNESYLIEEAQSIFNHWDALNERDKRRFLELSTESIIVGTDEVVVNYYMNLKNLLEHVSAGKHDAPKPRVLGHGTMEIRGLQKLHLA